MTDGGFDAVVAARYERDVRERFEPEHLRDVVGVLAELTGHRPALEFRSAPDGSRSHWQHVGSRSTGSNCRTR